MPPHLGAGAADVPGELHAAVAGHAFGEEVQIDPIKLRLKPPGPKRVETVK